MFNAINELLLHRSSTFYSTLVLWSLLIVCSYLLKLYSHILALGLRPIVKEILLYLNINISEFGVEAAIITVFKFLDGAKILLATNVYEVGHFQTPMMGNAYFWGPNLIILTAN